LRKSASSNAGALVIISRFLLYLQSCYLPKSRATRRMNARDSSKPSPASSVEIGSSGYNAALIPELVGPNGEVTTVDIDPEVVTRTRDCLAAAGYHGAHVVEADAENGVSQHDHSGVDADRLREVLAQPRAEAWSGIHQSRLVLDKKHTRVVVSWS
jgi:Protein-L-isoaspartate(D-aspartate) O-methyltransferase (PCMT)